MSSFFVFLVLLLSVVNGWTDAPSAIATCVSTRAVSPRSALLLAALSNLVGACTMALIRPGVAETVYGIANFGDDPAVAILALCSALIGVILWASAASLFGIPTSESHALLSGLSGAALACGLSLSSLDFAAWKRVIVGLALSTLPVMLLSFAIYRISRRVFLNQDRRRTMKYFRRVQIVGAISSAFLHGAQDSQKFIGVYMLGLSFIGHNSAYASGRFAIPFYITALCSLAMSCGTMLGGHKIIKKIGCEMTALDPLSSSAADTASSAFLGVCSFFGIPTATTHAKTCALMGIGLGELRKSRPLVMAQLFMCWLLTFPACALLGFALTLLLRALLL